MLSRFVLVALLVGPLSLQADEGPQFAKGQFSLKSLAVATACVAVLSAVVGTYHFGAQREAAYVAPVAVENLTVPEVQGLIEKHLPMMVSLHGHFVSRDEAVTIAAVLDAEMGDSIAQAYPGVQRFRDRIEPLGYRLTPSDVRYEYLLKTPEEPVSHGLFVEALTFVWLADSVRWERKVQSMQGFFLNVKPLQGNPADRVRLVR